MRVACKRGNVAARNKTGHCMCGDCVSFRNRRSNETKRPGYQAEWLAANKEKSKAYTAKWIATNTEQRREIERAWRAKNPDKVAQYNAKAGAKWASNNKAKRLASVRARQLAKIQRTPVWADMERIAKIYSDAARLTTETGEPYEVDHIVPLQGELVSGLHVHQNLRVVTRRENRIKKNVLIEELVCAA